MLLLSLLLQIILLILGNRRKYLRSYGIKILVWLSYLAADWVTVATLGKLPLVITNVNITKDQHKFLLKGVWASLLLGHLGGPDTITAFAIEDNKLWLRMMAHAALTIYIIVVSWTSSLLSIFSFPMFLAGIIKYSERTWCLYKSSLENSMQKTPLFDVKLLDNVTADCKDPTTDAEKVVLAHHWFAIVRPDINNYFSANLQSLEARLGPHLQEIVNLTDIRYLRTLMEKTNNVYLLDIVVIQSAFMYDMLYTKAAIVYTKLGCVLRLISSFCCISVLILLLKTSSGQVLLSDSWTTVTLLVGAVAQEIYALSVILSSDWTLLLRARYQKNCFIGGIFQSMHWLISKHHEKKRWSRSMGQFDLLSYCISLSKRKPSKILGMIGIDEKLQKLRHVEFKGIHSSLNDPETFPSGLPMPEEKTILPLGGELSTRSNLHLAFDHGVMIWHIATNICYHRCNSSGARITCKTISDYMMYLLAMKPSMVSPNASFWFDSFSSYVVKFCRDKNIVHEDETTVFQQLLHESGSASPNNGRLITIHGDQSSSFLPNYSMQLNVAILQSAQRIVSDFDAGSIGWDEVKLVWLKKLHEAAVNCPHVCHLEELTEGGEFLTLHWLIVNHTYHAASMEEVLRNY
ncbi:hypothetical protein PTKIN_Ptkin01aG0073300 [Pterospermum kingtungense]